MNAETGANAFAERVLTLLDEGSFTATYKYAVLLGLMDLCMERASAKGDPPRPSRRASSLRRSSNSTGPTRFPTEECRNRVSCDRIPADKRRSCP